MNKKVIILSVVIVLLGLGGIFVCSKLSSEQKFNKIDISVNIDNGDEDIKFEDLDNYDIKLEENITIDNEGVYNLTGSINNGSLVINTDGNVKLVLNNVNISNNSGPAIIVEKAENVFVELSNGSVNNLTDGSSYDNEDYSGCIFSRSDLIFSGNGTLNLVSNYLDGIVSTDDLKFISGQYVIDSNDDGIRGKDSVNIINGEFKIKSKNDGIKSNNELDRGKGFVNIVNGKFDITSEGDGIQAFNNLIIYNGEFVINSGNGEILGKALKSDGNILIENGKLDLVSNDDGIHANNAVVINDGNISVVTENDGINVSSGKNSDVDDNVSNNGFLEINGGSVFVSSDSDGIDVKGIFVINGGNIVSASSKEILEIVDKSKQGFITVNLDEITDGEIELLDSDDNKLISYNPKWRYSSIFISLSKLSKNSTYKLGINDEVVLEEINLRKN